MFTTLHHTITYSHHFKLEEGKENMLVKAIHPLKLFLEFDVDRMIPYFAIYNAYPCFVCIYTHV